MPENYATTLRNLDLLDRWINRYLMKFNKKCEDLERTTLGTREKSSSGK